MTRFHGVLTLAVSVVWAAPGVAQSRVLRVVDSATSKPIALAEVRDVVTAIVLRTSDAGIVTVTFTNRDTKRLLVRRIGYESKGVAVDVAGSDTLTVSLAPLSQSLASVSVEAARDHKLEMMGFYEREKSSAAPRSAFITAEDLERWKPTLLSDVKYRTGRSIGGCDTYLDGVRLAEARSRGNTLRRGIDAMVQPSEVAAMEVYRPSEAPVRYASTRGTCVLLIWLK